MGCLTNGASSLVAHFPDEDVDLQGGQLALLLNSDLLASCYAGTWTVKLYT